MRTLLFQRTASLDWTDATTAKDGDSGHARWQVEPVAQGAETLPREVLPLGWGEEYDVVTFLAQHPTEVAAALFPGCALSATDAVRREGLGQDEADLTFRFADGLVGLLEAKGTKPTENKRFRSTGEQLVSYARASQKVSHIAVLVGIGAFDGATRLPAHYNPEGWWEGATRSSRYKRHSAMLLRVKPNQIALIADEEPSNLKRLLSGLHAKDPYEGTLSKWVGQLRLDRAEPRFKRSEQPHDTHRRSHRIHLGTHATHAATSTALRWYLRIFEDHAWIYVQHEPDETLKSHLRGQNWQRFKKGAGPHYEIHRKHLGLLSEVDQGDITQRVCEHLPAAITEALRLA